MKTIKLRIGAVVCALLVSFWNMAPVSAASVNSTTSSTTISGLTATALVHTTTSVAGKTHGLGYLNPSVNIPQTAGSSNHFYRSSSLPTSYDLRSQNKLTSIKDQGSENDCWAYAALGSLESFLMPKENRDFSEADLVDHAGFDATAEDGGNALMATAYLARWSGPLNSGSTSGVQKHVQNVDWLPGRSGNTSATTDAAIKKAVMSTGAVFAPIYMDEISYYNASTHSYYDPTETTANHAVDIIGWDDSYSASNFTTTAGGTPSDNGAFICRNSWGTDWGDSGYFYVSYDDRNIGQDESAAFDSAQATSNYTQNYQYDPLGYTGAISIKNASQKWMANVFTATSSDALSAVGFYTAQSSTSYRVYVIPNYTGSLANGTLEASGTVDDAGYHTVSLSDKIALTQGDSFAVEVEFLDTDNAIPVEGPVSGYSSAATASAGQSFVSANGSDWDDTTAIQNISGFIPPQDGNSNINVCLKAFTVQLPQVSNNSLTANAAYYGGIPVSGTVSASPGITQVTVAADGQTLYTASGSGASTTQMDYTYTIPAGTLSAGSHTVTVTATDTNGTTGQKCTPITVGSPIVDMDTPSDGSAVSGDLSVSGWSVDASGVTSNTVYVDPGTSNQKQFDTTAVSRPDVQKAIYPNGDYPNGVNSGYTTTIPSTALTAGSHIIRVTMTAQDGSTHSESRTVVVGPSPLTDIDTPSDGTSVNGTISIAGWALNHSGINRVDMYAFDSKGTPHFLGSVSAAEMTARADVQQVYPAYGTINSGYRLTAQTNTLAAGTYTLAVAGIGNDGDVQWATKSITVGPAPLTDIDTPSGGASVNGTISVAGWALNHSGINRVDLYAFDSSGTPHFLGSVPAAEMTARSDVQKVYPAYGTLKSGYNLSVQTNTLAAGAYTLAVAGIGNDGDVQWETKAITVGPAPLTDIDTPSDGASVNGTLSVSGWALNHSGINRVDLYVFDSSGTPHFLGSVPAAEMTARADVKKVYPAYDILNSGYSLTVRTDTLAAGTYTLSVAGIGNDGDVQWETKRITIG